MRLAEFEMHDYASALGSARHLAKARSGEKCYGSRVGSRWRPLFGRRISRDPLHRVGAVGACDSNRRCEELTGDTFAAK